MSGIQQAVPTATSSSAVPAKSNSILTGFTNCLAPLKNCTSPNTANVVSTQPNLVVELQQIRAKVKTDAAKFKATMEALQSKIDANIVPDLTKINEFCAKLDIIIKGWVQLLTQLEVLIPVPQVQAGIGIALGVLQLIDFGLDGTEALNKYIIQQKVANATGTLPLTTDSAATLIDTARANLPNLINAIQDGKDSRIISASVNTDDIANKLTTALNDAELVNKGIAITEATANATQAALAQQPSTPAPAATDDTATLRQASTPRATATLTVS